MVPNTRKPEPADVAKSCASFNLRKATRAVTQLYAAALAPSGLESTQFSLLVALALNERAPLSRVAEKMVMDRTTLTRNLQPLVKQGWVTVEPGPDRRERYIALTRAGRGVLDRALPLWQGVQGRVAGALGPQRLAALIGELDTLVRVAHGGAA